MAPQAVLGGETLSADVLRLIDEADRKLQAGEIASALTLLNKHASESPWIVNAIGVCSLRDNHLRAVQTIFQSLATDGGFLRRDVPGVFCLNLGISRLLQRNFTGFEAALKVIDRRTCPAATKYLSQYRSWQKSHTLGERLRFTFTRESDRPFSLDFPPGELR
jgi:hypothetical protein